MRYPLLKSTEHEPIIELPYGNYGYHPNPTEEDIHFISNPPITKTHKSWLLLSYYFWKAWGGSQPYSLPISIWNWKEANRKNGEYGTYGEKAQRFNKDLDQQSLSLFSNARVLQTPMFKIHFLY